MNMVHVDKPQIFITIQLYYIIDEFPLVVADILRIRFDLERQTTLETNLVSYPPLLASMTY